MALIPIEHPHRLASPAAGEALLGALREKWVAVSHVKARDREDIAAIIDAVAPKRDSSISWKGGALDDKALEALGTLAVSRFGYLDVRGGGQSLRIWPGSKSWFYTDGDSGMLETPDPAEAFAALRAKVSAGHPLSLGHISKIETPAGPALLDFLVAAGCEVSCTIEIAIAAARVLTERFVDTGAQWQAPPVMIQWPEGKIHGYLILNDALEKNQRKWLARIDKGLRRAKLT